MNCIQKLSIALLFPIVILLNAGCGMVTGAGLFGAAALEVLQDKPDYYEGGIKPVVSRSQGSFSQDSISYRYKLDRDPGVILTKRVKFSSGKQKTRSLSLQRKIQGEGQNAVYFGPVIGYTSREYEVKIDNQTEECRERINFFGAMVELDTPIMLYGQYVAGRGSWKIDLLDDIPPFPDGSFRFRYTRLELGAGHSLTSWLQVKAGVSLDTFALPDKLSRQVVKIRRTHIKIRLWREVRIVAFTPLSWTRYIGRMKPSRLCSTKITRMSCNHHRLVRRYA